LFRHHKGGFVLFCLNNLLITGNTVLLEYNNGQPVINHRFYYLSLIRILEVYSVYLKFLSFRDVMIIILALPFRFSRFSF